MFHKLFGVALVSTLLFSCSKEHVEEESSAYVPFSVPEGFPEATHEFLGDNVKSEEAVFELGRKLFYEPKLSSDNSISCAECHEQSFVFTHHGHQLSPGVNGVNGIRNTQALQNLAFQTSFNWDGTTPQLFQQPLIPISAEHEMNETMSDVIAKLSEETDYLEAFKAAFYDEEISTSNILKSFANFMGMMISDNSKYDQVLRGEQGIVFTEDELAGKVLFEQKCATCHSGILFTDESFRNNGLTVNSKIPDELGRQSVTSLEEDYYKFKVPSLRNIEKSAPYMHDGRINSLRGVLNYYDSGVQATANLDPLLNQNGTLGIPLTEDEKDLLLAFLYTLTDDDFLNDERFTAPL